jgi:transcriptional regulator of nitric oxide reductase
MQKIVIIARSQAEAEKGGKLLSEFNIKQVFPGVKRFPRHFDAIVVYHNE